MSEENGMPYIFKKERKLNLNENVMEETSLTIQGPDSKENLKEFDKRWKK